MWLTAEATVKPSLFTDFSVKLHDFTRGSKIARVFKILVMQSEEVLFREIKPIVNTYIITQTYLLMLIL